MNQRTILREVTGRGLGECRMVAAVVGVRQLTSVAKGVKVRDARRLTLVAGQAALTAGAAESAGWTEKSSGKQPVRGSGGTRPTGAPTAPAVSVVPSGRLPVSPADTTEAG